MNILLFSRKVLDGLNLFVGEDCPADATFLSRVPTSIAPLLSFAFTSDSLSDGLRLKNINFLVGRKTLIINAIAFALESFWAERADF